MTATVRVAAFLPRSRANGPGVRAVLWVQGCPRRCPGCFNPEFLPFVGGADHAVDDVVRWVLDARGCEGLTLSGGEPFAQATALAEVARRVRGAGLGVVAFTGLEWAALRADADSGRAALLASCDALIAGPYDERRPGRHPLLASANQLLVLLTRRYRQSDFSGPLGRRVEYHIGADGHTTLTGLPVGPSHARRPAAASEAPWD